jgi:hypothetical protein
VSDPTSDDLPDRATFEGPVTGTTGRRTRRENRGEVTMGDLLELPITVIDEESYDELDLSQGYGDGYDDLFDDIEFFDLDDADDDPALEDDGVTEHKA